MEGYRLRILVLSLAIFQLLNHAIPCTGQQPPNTEFIITSCKPSRFPEVCYASLEKHAGEIKNCPKTLAVIALGVTLDLVKQAKTTVKGLSETKSLKPVEKMAMSDCVKELDSTEKQLVKSKDELASIVDPANSRLKINNVQTWVSAALTDQSTCKDGFSDHILNGPVEIETRKNITKLSEMTSVCLTLINSYASATKPPLSS